MRYPGIRTGYQALSPSFLPARFSYPWYFTLQSHIPEHDAAQSKMAHIASWTSRKLAAVFKPYR